MKRRRPSIPSAWIVPIFLLFVAVPLPAGAGTPTPGNGEELVTRTYDLSCLQWKAEHFPAPSSLRLPLLPFLFPRWRPADEVRVESDLFEELDEEFLQDLLVRVIGEEYFEKNGGTLSFVEERKLFVRASQPVQEKVRTVLEYLSAVLNRRVKVAVECFELPPDSYLEGEALDRAVEEGALPLVFARTVEVRTGVPVFLEDGEHRFLLFDYDSEIAQGNVVADDVRGALFCGLRVVLRPYIVPGSGKVLLSMYVLSDRVHGPLPVRRGRFSGRIVTDERLVQKVPVADLLDDPDIPFASMVTIFFLKPGEPVRMVVDAPPREGGARFMLRLTARPDPEPRPLILDGGRTLAALDLSAFQGRSIPSVAPGPPTVEPWTKGNADLEATNLRCDLGPATRLQGWIPDRLLEFWSGDTVRVSDPGGGEETSVMETAFRAGDFLFFLLPAEAWASLKNRVLATVSGIGEGLHVSIAFRSLDGPPAFQDAARVLEEGRPLGGMELGLLSGRRTCVLTGREGLEILEYDVDVATQAAVAHPVTFPFLDGIFATFRAEGSRPEEGALPAVRVHMYLSLLCRPRETVDLGSEGGLAGLVDRLAFRTGIVNTRFPADGKPHLLGSMNLPGEEGPRTLYLVGRASPLP